MTNLATEPMDDQQGAEPAPKTIAQLLVPFSEQELAAAKAPHPHVFQRGHKGLFPVGEVTVVAAPGREGKTTIMAAICGAVATGQSIGGLQPMPERSVIIYSAEDGRSQYARKVGAMIADLPKAERALVMQNLIVPDLDDPNLVSCKAVVDFKERKAKRTPTPLELVTGIAASDIGRKPALIVFETASTINRADESNESFAVLVDTLKYVARELGVAVVLTHHLSQAGTGRLPYLDVSVSDVRGMTSLVSNSRQNIMLVSLGSDAEPFPATDSRSTLRHLASGGHTGRLTVMITLDTSQGENPEPVYFAWDHHSDYGPAAREIVPANNLAGLSWRRTQERVQATRQTKLDVRKAKEADAKVAQVVQAVNDLAAESKQATVRQVSAKCGKSGADWARLYLEQALEAGLIRSEVQRVPRVKDPCTVYLPDDLSIDIEAHA